MSKLRRGAKELPPMAADRHDKEIVEVRSITPRTHVSRDLYEDIAAVQQPQNLPPPNMESMYYIDIYNHASWACPEGIRHYGIDNYNRQIRLDVEQHNLIQAPKMLNFKGSKSSASNAKNYPKFVSQIILTSHEELLIKEAMRYLADNNEKVVLVDTFPREQNSKNKKWNVGDIEIPQLPDQPLTTHAVILYNSQKAGKILVLDPSNPQFSGHLQNMGFVDLLVDQAFGNIRHKIYTPKETGPKGDQYRDCIDISVKLAALLHVDPIEYVSHTEILESKAVWFVSNNQGITKIKIDQPLRMKQVSNLVRIEEFNDKLLQGNNKYKQIVESLEEKEEKDEGSLQQQIKLLRDQLQIDLQQSENQYKLEMVALIGQTIADLVADGEGGDYA